MTTATWTIDIPISKMDEDQNLVFGWANVPHPVGKLGAPKIDLQDDQIWLEDLEKGAYEFVLNFRDADDMHTDPVVGKLVESMVFTPEKMEAMGIEKWEGNYGWWTGWKVNDDAFAKVKSGDRSMFSIGGKAKMETVS